MLFVNHGVLFSGGSDETHGIHCPKQEDVRAKYNNNQDYDPVIPSWDPDEINFDAKANIAYYVFHRDVRLISVQP